VIKWFWRIFDILVNLKAWVHSQALSVGSAKGLMYLVKFWV